jgi:hypothetical protein
LAWETAGAALLTTTALLSVASIWRLNFNPSAASARELWRPTATTQGATLARETLQELSQAHTGLPDAIGVSVTSQVSPPLAWTIRSFQPPSEANPDDMLAPAVIVQEEGAASLPTAEAYIGQSFYAQERWGWTGVLPPDPIRWWVQSDAPTETSTWLIFLRTDLAYLGEELIPSADTPADP